MRGFVTVDTADSYKQWMDAEQAKLGGEGDSFWQ
jgi:hypothetical protein